MRLTIGKKLGFGFGLMIILNAMGGKIIYHKVKYVNTVQDRVVNLRTPTAITGVQLHNGINHSLAALRGYMILGSDKWIDERSKAWDSLDQDIATMKDFSTNWTNPEKIQKLNEFITIMDEFRVAQQLVEDIANSPQEQPAMNILVNDATPRASIMLASITEMINQEKELEATPQRKALLATMADSRGSLAVGLSSIRAYLLTGDIAWADSFHTKWEINTDRLATLQENTSLLNPAQIEAFKKYSQARAEFNPFPDQMFEIRGSDDWNMAHKLLSSEAAPKAAQAIQLLDWMTDNQKELLANDEKALNAGSHFLLTMVIVSTSLATIAGCFIAVLLTRTITKPIKNLIKAIDEGQGDLTMRVDESRSDEIGELGGWFNKFVINMQDIICQLRDSSQAVASASTQIAASSDEMAGGLQEQEMQTQQVAAAVEELSQSISEVASKSADATTASAESQHLAEDGGRVVRSTVEEMERISTEVNASAQTINALGEQSQKIGEIIAVINDIADQTNLLALNAAIEAARAGEHGRGFAVVADEVRKLAERTTEATEEVSSSINGIQKETASAVTQIESSSERVGTGVDLANQAGASLETIVVGSQSVQGMVQDIAAAATQQASASDEIARSVEGISGVTRQTSESASQASQAAGDLAKQSEHLMSLVNQFKID
ncbi:MAG: methyl-accepting chemotaxis protein [Phycisphaerales bacterium]|nr:methyl-accepting chemotaxis protein [Phycisphaerales bacterium]